MEKVIVAVGTTRGPKLSAAQEVLKTLGAEIDAHAEFEVIGVAVPSGVGHTPATREDARGTACGAGSRKQRDVAIFRRVGGRARRDG